MSALVPQLLQTRLVQQVHLIDDEDGHERSLAAEQRLPAARRLGKVHLLLQQIEQR